MLADKNRHVTSHITTIMSFIWHCTPIYKTGKYSISTEKQPYQIWFLKCFAVGPVYSDSDKSYVGENLKNYSAESINLIWLIQSCLSLSEYDCPQPAVIHCADCGGKGQGWCGHKNMSTLITQNSSIILQTLHQDRNKSSRPINRLRSLSCHNTSWTWRLSLTWGQMVKESLPQKCVIKWQSIMHSHIVHLIMMQY